MAVLRGRFKFRGNFCCLNFKCLLVCLEYQNCSIWKTGYKGNLVLNVTHIGIGTRDLDLDGESICIMEVKLSIPILRENEYQ